MAHVLVIGATGETGSRLCRQLVAGGHVALGLHRYAGQAALLRADGVVPVSGDLVTATVDSLSAAMAGVDAVVFTAGANSGGNRMTDTMDGQGVVLAAQGAMQAGVRRFLLVSAFPDAWREKRMPPDFEHYMFIKRQADVFLSGTDLDWVIVRPGTLLNTPGTGTVRACLAIPYGDISRDDVAATLYQLIEQPGVNRVIVELTSGARPVADAVAGME